MKRCLILTFLLLTLFNCKTVSNNETDDTEDLRTSKSDEIYDLTVLKNESYPTIKNNSSFTEIELEILRGSDGLEIEATPEIAHYFKYFLRDKRELIELWIDNSREIIPYIRGEFDKEGLPADLIYLPFLESGYNSMAYSRVGAGGIWQFMPKTARSYGLNINWWIDERRSPWLATPYAIKHLKHLNKKFDSWYIALAAYNAGEGRVSRAMNKVNTYDYFKLIETKALPRETRRYIPQYIAIIKIMKNLDKLGFDPINWDNRDNYKSITIPGGHDLYSFCSAIDLSWVDFKKLNPAYRRMINNPSMNSHIVVPIAYLNKSKNYFKTNRPITKDGYYYYRVKKGDSWWLLSQTTDTDINSLKRLNNNIGGKVRVGQRLLLPSNKKAAKIVNKKTTERLKVHTVKNGDTISSISISYNIKLSALYKENNLNSYSILQVGQKLKLPGYPIKDKVVKNVTKKTNTQNIKSREKSKTNLIHKVVYGDTLSGISYRYDVALKSLMLVNKIKNPSNIKVGDLLKIPQNNMYTVQSGDSVWLIAQKTKIPYKRLLSLNNLNKNSRLKVGDSLRLY